MQLISGLYRSFLSWPVLALPVVLTTACAHYAPVETVSLESPKAETSQPQARSTQPQVESQPKAVSQQKTVATQLGESKLHDNRLGESKPHKNKPQENGLRENTRHQNKSREKTPTSQNAERSPLTSIYQLVSVERYDEALLQAELSLEDQSLQSLHSDFRQIIIHLSLAPDTETYDLERAAMQLETLEPSCQKSDQPCFLVFRSLVARLVTLRELSNVNETNLRLLAEVGRLHLVIEKLRALSLKR